MQSIQSATDGNAFFAEEMTVHLIDSDMIVSAVGGAALRDDSRSVGIPQMVRDTLARRLLSLSSDAMDLLSAGSLIGREFDLSVAGMASGLNGTSLVESTDDALMSGLVVEASAGRLSFSHALVQHAVSERLSYARKAVTHRRLAEGLEAMSGDDPATVAELARHWAEVASVDKTASTTAAKWAVRAGDVALASAAPDEAIARYEEASSLWAVTTADHADALIRLGLALQYRGRADEGDERFRQANHLAVALGHAELQARAAIGLGRRYAYWETDDERTQVLEDALAALDQSEGLLRPTIMAMLVTHLIAGFNADEARHRDEMAAEVRAVATNPEIGGEVLLSLGRTRIYDSFEDPEQLAPTCERLARVAQKHSDLRVLAGARFAQALAALDRADMPQLRTRCDEYEEVVVRLDDPRERSQLSTARSTLAFIEGRYDDAAASSDQALDQARASGDFNADLVHYAARDPAGSGHGTSGDRPATFGGRHRVPEHRRLRGRDRSVRGPRWRHGPCARGARPVRKLGVRRHPAGRGLAGADGVPGADLLGSRSPPARRVVVLGVVPPAVDGGEGGPAHRVVGHRGSSPGAALRAPRQARRGRGATDA